jgi:hypothetical protein
MHARVLTCHRCIHTRTAPSTDAVEARSHSQRGAPALHVVPCDHGFSMRMHAPRLFLSSTLLSSRLRMLVYAACVHGKIQRHTCITSPRMHTRNATATCVVCASRRMRVNALVSLQNLEYTQYTKQQTHEYTYTCTHIQMRTQTHARTNACAPKHTGHSHLWIPTEFATKDHVRKLRVRAQRATSIPWPLTTSSRPSECSRSRLLCQ